MNLKFKKFIFQKFQKNLKFKTCIFQITQVYESKLVKGFLVVLEKNQQFFIKIFSSRNSIYHKKIFSIEVNLLKIIKKYSSFSVPRIYMYRNPTYGKMGYIIMEYIPISLLRYNMGRYFIKKLAFNLYELHSISNNYCGYDFNNYYGYFKNINSPEKNWCCFFIENRIKYQIYIAIKKKLWSSNYDKRLSIFLNRITDWIPKDEKISLLHGDFWAGNCMISKKGEVYIIDPSIYFGSREMDLSSFLFYSSFLYKNMANSFLNFYQEYYPLAKDFEKRFKIYNLYYQLIMMNTYGKRYRYLVLKTLSLF